MNLKEIIKNAKEHKACKKAITILEQCSDIEEAINLKEAQEYMCWYARYVLKGRWTEAEPYLINDPSNSYLYARFVMNERWI